VGVQEKL